MKISHGQHAFLPRDPALVFGVIDDFSSTHQWLNRCIRLHRSGKGENRVGDPLRFFYRGVARDGVVAGVIVSRRPLENLSCEYVASRFKVLVDFSMRPHGNGTYLTHTIDITARSPWARLAAPLIRRAASRHVRDAMSGLRTYLLRCHALE
jgi:Polyketide cyclase / dehydrase and lipid transport